VIGVSLTDDDELEFSTIDGELIALGSTISPNSA
jgi:hypothetical protein